MMKRWVFPIIILIIGFACFICALIDEEKHPTLTQKQMYFLNVHGVYIGDK